MAERRITRRSGPPLRGTRITFAALLAVAASAVLGGTAEAATPALPSKEPVVLVHGFVGSNNDMEKMRAALVAAGHPAYVADLPGEENVANAQAVARVVTTAQSEHDGAKVSLVGHSMGGLSTRWYLAKLGGSQKVVSYVSMGTSQFGYQPACQLPENVGGQMCPGSRFLTELNADDETPGDVRYTTLYSSLDESKDQRLDGAACNAEFPGVAHPDEPRTAVFIDAVEKSLDGICPA